MNIDLPDQAIFLELGVLGTDQTSLQRDLQIFRTHILGIFVQYKCHLIKLTANS